MKPTPAFAHAENIKRTFAREADDRFHLQRSLAAACSVALLSLGLACGAFAGPVPAGVVGGQGGSIVNPYADSMGGAAGNGGQGGRLGTLGYPGAVGSAGTGGEGGGSGHSGHGGGAGGSPGTLVTITSVVTTGTGNAGHDGKATAYYDSGGGGGGGGDGIVATISGVEVIVPLVAIQGGAGGAGGNGAQGPSGSIYNYGGAGGGGGNGVEFTGAGVLLNSGGIAGGAGGRGGGTDYTVTIGPSGSGGGHGVVGANLVILNSGFISGGTAGGFYPGNHPHGAAGTNGDAVLFTGGANELQLETGSIISGDIELADATSGVITSHDNATSLSGRIILDTASSSVTFNTMTAGLTVSGAITGASSGGPGSVIVSGDVSHPVVLTATNAFAAGTTSVNSGSLQMDGSIGTVYVNAGVLGGIGTVEKMTIASGAIVSPGEPAQVFGVLHAHYAPDLNAGSTLTIHSSADGSECSSLHSTNNINVHTGSNLLIQFQDIPAIGASCTFARADGLHGVRGTFANITSPRAAVTITYTMATATFTVIDASIFADGFEINQGRPSGSP